MSAAGFTLREGWRSHRRSGLAGALAVLSLAVLSGFVCVFAGAQQSLTLARQRLLSGFELEAFVEPARERLLGVLADSLRRRPDVREVVVIDKQRAAERFVERHGEEILGLLEENPLPASLIVRYRRESVTADRLAREAEEITELDAISEVVYEGDVMRDVEELSVRLRLVALAAGAFVLVISVVLTLQSVRVAARTGREWARAVMLVGGRRKQVRAPLAMGGAFTGLFGGLIGAGIAGSLQWLLSGSPWIVPPDPRVLVAAGLLPVLLGVLGAAPSWPREP
ncbi:MAG: Cell division protein FtsX [Calditrichaeota bacterium]|nr:Cell division protein FtsX [Calditrichota bacterium]